jgi:hypothetical protein
MDVGVVSMLTRVRSYYSSKDKSVLIDSFANIKACIRIYKSKQD